MTKLNVTSYMTVTVCLELEWQTSYFSAPSTPACVIKSPMFFSKSSMRLPISSMRDRI